MLDSKGLYVKELAAMIGIKKGSIDNYFNRNSIPNADIAVKIAKALDTSVEYLMTGNDSIGGVKFTAENIRLLKLINSLEDIDRKVVEDLIQSFIDRKQSGLSAMETSRIG